MRFLCWMTNILEFYEVLFLKTIKDIKSPINSGYNINALKSMTLIKSGWYRWTHLEKNCRKIIECPKNYNWNINITYFIGDNEMKMLIDFLKQYYIKKWENSWHFN